MTHYFEPDKNRIYQVYLFRQVTQQSTESMDEFHTRLRRLAKYCEFTDIDFEIKMQIVCNGTSTRIRKRTLRDPGYSLKDILIDGRKAQTSAVQASEMEGQFQRQSVNAVPTNQRKCFRCGFEFPHERRPCPALNSVCANCGTEGHFARVCRKDKTFPAKQRPEQPRARARSTHPPDKKFQQNMQQARAVQEAELKSSFDDSSSDENYAYTISQDNKPTLKTTVRMNKNDVSFLVDTGATVDLIDSATYDRLKRNVPLRKSSTKIYAYGSKTPLPLKGQFQATLESKKRYMVTQLYVVEGMGGNLLSAKTAQDLELIKLINTVSSIPGVTTDYMPSDDLMKDESAPPSSDLTQTSIKSETQSAATSSDPHIQEILNKYSTVFEGQGKLNNQQIGLHIRDDVKPVIQPQRRIPYHMRKEVSQEVQKLLEQDIIEEVVNQPTPWISPIVCTPQKDGGTRICVDMREANQAIERERHVMPTLQDFKAEVNGSKFFSKLDLKQAYHQLELEPESRFITTFSTHEGLFRYKRLKHGTCSAAEIFQNVLEKNLRDIRGVKNIADDIIIHGKTKKEHDEALENCLKRLATLNLKVKGEKCCFLQKEIKFYGLIFTAEGTKPDPERISKLVNVSRPTNSSEVRSFLGMANTCHEYIPNYATITVPL